MELVNRPREATIYQKNIIEQALSAIRRGVLSRIPEPIDIIDKKIEELRVELYRSRGLIPPGAPPLVVLTRELSDVFFQELRGVVETSIWGYNYMDVVPLYSFDIDKWAARKLDAIETILHTPDGVKFQRWLRRPLSSILTLPTPNRGAVNTIIDYFAGKNGAVYNKWLDDVAARIIHAKKFTRHGGPIPEAHYGPAVSAGQLTVEFDWSTCVVRRLPRDGELHTVEIFDYLCESGSWRALNDIACNAPDDDFVDRLRYHYYILLQPLAARVMARVVGSITGAIKLVIADYRAEHISNIFVTLGKYLESWDVQIDLRVRSETMRQRCVYCQDLHGIPKDEIISAMAIYLETAHKIYRRNVPQGRSLAGGPYLPSNCINVPDLPLYHQVRQLYNKYDANYGAQCQHPDFTPAEKEQLVADYVAKLIAGAPRCEGRPKYTVVIAAPGTGKSTYLKMHVRQALMLVRDDIIVDINGGYSLDSTANETRAALDADLSTINSPLARFIRGNLSARCRLCKDNFWELAELIMKNTIKTIYENDLPINICVETIGVNTDYQYLNDYSNGFNVRVVYLRIAIDKEHRQQLGRLLVENRVNDFYKIIDYAKIAMDGFLKYYRSGRNCDIFMVTDDPPLTQIMMDRQKINKPIGLGYLDRSFLQMYNDL